MPTESVTATLPRGSKPRMESRLADDQSACALNSRDLATDQSANRMSLGHFPNTTGHIYDSVAQRCGSLGRRWTGDTRSCPSAEMQRLSHPSSCSVQQTSVESCDPRLCFLTSSEMSDDDRMSLTTPISDEEEGASSNPAGYGDHTADGMAASFNCTGAVRKAGYLSVKKWLLRKKHQVELARKRGWKGYWVCLKGTTLLFYPCESDEGRSIEQAPKHLIIVDGAIMQAIPEHPKRENIFCLSTAFGDAYLFQAPCESELDNWVNSIHTACAAAFARHRGKTGTLHLLQEEILRQERSIDSDSKLKYMAELQQGLTEDSVEKADVSTQIAVYDESLERLHCEQFRLKCYMASLQGGELPNPKGLLTRVSRGTKITLNRLGVFAVSSFHAYICARSPSLLNNLLAGRGATKRRAPMLGSSGSSGSNLYFNEGDDCGTGPRRSYRVQLPDQQCVSIGLRDNMTVEDFLVNACLRKDLNPPEHFLRVKKRRESETVSYFVPLRTDLVQAYLQTYEVCEICVKRLYQTELTRRDLSQMWGFSVEAELIENLDRQDELCCYISRVEEKSLAGVNGLIRGDEMMVINGAIVADLDMMYIETLLQEEVSLCIMARTARTEPPCVEDTEPSTDELIERLVCPPPPSEAIVSEQAVGGMIAPSIRTWELDSIKPTPYAPAYSDISEQSQLSVFTDDPHQGASPCRSPMDRPRTASPTSSVTSTQSQSTQPAGGARSTELPDTRQAHTSHELDSWTDVESPPPMEHAEVQQLDLERPVELPEGAGHRPSNESIERTNQPIEQLQESERQLTEQLQESGSHPTEKLQNSKRQPTEQLTVRWQVCKQQEIGQAQSEDAETDQSVVKRKSQEPPEIRRKPPRQIEAKQQSMKHLMKNEQAAEELETECHQPEKHQAKLQLTDADKLKMQLRELIDTERSYVQNLNSLIDNYLAPLRGEDFISDGEVDALFGNIPNIVSFQRQFLICLEQAIGHESLLLRLESPEQFKDVLFSVGNAFLQHSLSFKLYSTFCTSHSRAQKVLHPNEGNQQLQQFLQRQNPGQQHSSTLESYLIKPIQRILKYPLILQQLRGLADPQSGEYYHLEEALKAMEKIAEYINEVQRIHEEYGAIFDHLARQHEKSSSVLPLTTFVDLSPGELLHYGGVEWLNIGEFLGKIKKGLELHSMCFVFRTAVVLLCKERLRQKKRLMGAGGKGGTSEVEIVRYQVLIPVTEVQVRSNSEKDTGTRFLWDLLHLKSQIHRRNEKIYHLSNSDNEYRNSFLRTIRLSIRESVRNMSIPVSKTSGGGLRASGTLQPNRTLSGRRRAENGRPYPGTLAPKVSLGALNSKTGDSGSQKSQNKTINKHEQ